jgi:hypothetical protein
VNLSRRGRIVVIAALAAVAVIIVINFLNPATTTTPVTPAVVPTQVAPTETSTPTPQATSEATRIDGVKARAAMDMAMALVAGTLSIDYQVDPTEILKSIRDFSTFQVQAQVAARLKAMDWADLKARKVVRFADVTDVVPYATNQNSQIPQHVDVTVTIYEGTGANPKKVDTQTWTVAVGSGHGANGWVGTSLTLKPTP